MRLPSLRVKAGIIIATSSAWATIELQVFYAFSFAVRPRIDCQEAFALLTVPPSPVRPLDSTHPHVPQSSEAVTWTTLRTASSGAPDKRTRRVR